MAINGIVEAFLFVKHVIVIKFTLNLVVKEIVEIIAK